MTQDEADIPPTYERIRVQTYSAATDDSYRSTRSSELLAHAVLDELRSTNAFMQFGVPEPVLETFAEAVSSRVSSAFEVNWSPDWVSQDEPHTWEEADGWHSRCNVCLTEGPAVRKEKIAIEWFDSHHATNHLEHT